MKSARSIRIFTGISLTTLAISAISALAFGTVTASINKIDAFAGIDNRPDKKSSAVNYLLVGSDTREGLSKAELKALRVGSVATAAGKRSDTMLLVHISKARDAAFIVSIPRDTLVTIPAHRSQDGTRDIPARPGKINAAFAFGGAPLLIQTIEDKTNLKIDHYVEVSFAGFTGVVDALGGIEVCSKVAINDPKSHLVMAAGTHLLDGIEALKYVRTRDFDGRGDIGRMERQQQFVGAVLRKATSSGVLLNPIKLTRFYNATISTVKMDSSVNKNDLLTLAKQMRNLSSSSVRTLTVPLSDPNGSYPGVGSVVIWDEELSTDLWTRIRGDEVLVETIKPTAKATTEPVIIDKFKSKTAADNPCAPAK